MVLAEFNTHRMLSRNSASSRAVPFETMLKRVQENPFIPMRWMKDHKGMQGAEYFEDPSDIKELEATWLVAKDEAVSMAELLSEQGLTKQIVNRLLEPFMWHTVIVTASEWENFFALRAHEAAEIHIQHLAHMMLDEYNKSTPNLLNVGEWHIPFGKIMDEDRIEHEIRSEMEDPAYQITEEDIAAAKLQIATARCARVSYTNYEGKDDYGADIRLHTLLSSMGHWSPFEHCAKAMEANYFSGNFCGFEQYRKEFVGENKKDERVKSKYNA